MNAKNNSYRKGLRACVSGQETSTSGLEARLQRVFSLPGDSLCELRLDYLSLSPKDLLQWLSSLPSSWRSRLILTLRRKDAGELAQGHCAWDLSTWLGFWRALAGLDGWHLFDIDWSPALPLEALPRKTNLMFSWHCPLAVLDANWRAFAETANEAGAGIKIATEPKNPIELWQFAKLRRRLRKRIAPNLPQVFVAMGSAGRAWRWSKLAGSFTYCALNSESATASGQALFKDLIPYAQREAWPEIYVLWGDDPQNLFGERHWNAAFHKGKRNARYIALACDRKVDNPRSWSIAALQWMREANIRGASVTKPFKLCFATLGSQRGFAINTIARTGSGWRFSNTDGPAVLALLRTFSPKAGSALVIGGGGAGQAVAKTLRAAEWKVHLCRRNRKGALPKPEEILAEYRDSPPSIWICAWPAQYQRALLPLLEALPKPELLLDAQLQNLGEDAILRQFCKQNHIAYRSGAEWWGAQAVRQFRAWGLASDFFRDLLLKLPSSKSETARALAIGAFVLGKARVQAPSHCNDTEVFRNALSCLGVEVRESNADWVVESRKGSPVAPKTIAIDCGESATALRFMAALSTTLEPGKLYLNAAPSLRKRPQSTLQKIFKLSKIEWPLEIKTGMKIPPVVSLAETSQLASGFIIAAAAQIERGERKAFALNITGPFRSWPYVELTLEQLKKFGFSAEISHSKNKKSLNLRKKGTVRPRKSHLLVITSGLDYSGLAFLETACRYRGLPSLRTQLTSKNASGDAIFFTWLDAIELGGKTIFSLAHNPDLAPPLFAAAILWRRSLEIVDAPHLHGKESNRAQGLVAIARQLGLPAQVTHDGLQLGKGVSTSRDQLQPDLVLPVLHDHRLAMAAGLLRLAWPGLNVDDRGCVAKSFPRFWEALEQIEKGLP